MRPRVEPARSQSDVAFGSVWDTFPVVWFYRYVRGRLRRQCKFCASWLRHEAVVCPRCQREQ